MERRALPIIMLVMLVVVIVVTTIFAFSIGSGLLNALGLGPTPTPIPLPTPTPTPTPSPTPTPDPDKPPLVNAKAVFLIDMDSQRVLDSVHSTSRLGNASTTKIMTALVAMRLGNLNQVIIIPQEAVDRVNVDGASSAGLVAGDTFYLKDLLYGMLIPSGADAAVAVADGLSGSVSLFVYQMNLEARRLGLTNTHFTTVDGLAPLESGHYSSAADMTHLARYAMLNYPLFAQIVQQRHYDVHPALRRHAYSWDNTNPLLGSYPGMIGVKTGNTNAAGWCLVFAAQRNGHSLIGTVLGAEDSGQRDTDVTNLLNWAFDYEARHHL
jgi:D-alanyl-D-alanine carboxypeptidase (penicillin-binding protein 5/6)